MTTLSTRLLMSGTRSRQALIWCVAAALFLAAVRGVGVDTSQVQTRLEPALVEKVDPVYPAELKRRNIEGVVKARYTIDTDGKVVAVQATTDSRTEFRRAVEAALEQWRFEPPLMQGAAVRVERTLEVRFERPDEQPSAAGHEAAAPLGEIAESCVPCPCEKKPDFT